MIKGFRVTSLNEFGSKQLEKNMGYDRNTKIITEAINPLVVVFLFNYKGVLKALQKQTVDIDVIKLGVNKFMGDCVEGQDYLVEAIENE